MATNNAINANQTGIQMYNGSGVFSQGAYPMCHNIGIAYSAGTFTVQGSDGTALSATNPGYVTLQSKATPGRLRTILVTANQTFTDGSAGTTDNARFGLVTGVNWLQDIPFFLYGVMDDTEALINFMISRNPAATTSPASTSISKTGAIINVGQGDFFSLGNITVTSYDSNPCICLGSFRMQFTGATDHWTVQTLSTSDGIGQYNDQTYFLMPTGVNGASSGTFFRSNAGTEPAFSGTTTQNYQIFRNGMVRHLVNLQTCTTPGVGAQTLEPVLAYSVTATAQESVFSGVFTDSSTQVRSGLACGALAGTSYINEIYSFTGSTLYTNATIELNDSLQITAFYKAYP